MECGLDILWYYFSSFMSVIQPWQTMIVGLLAVFFAAITVHAIRGQIALQEQQYLDNRISKSWAARARMPDALSALSVFCNSVVETLNTPNSDFPTLPLTDIETLKVVIEHVEPKAAKRAFELVSLYQVHNSRLKSHFKRRVGQQQRIAEADWDVAIYDVAELQALIYSLFEYARNEVSIGPTEKLSRDEMISGLKGAVSLENYAGNEQRYVDVVERIERMFPNPAG